MMSRPKLLDRIRQEIRRRNYSPRTEQAYCRWVIRFVRFHAMTHPVALNSEDVEEFLNYLSLERGVSASTQNQALSALVFLYRDVMGREIGRLKGLKRAKRPKILPVVLSEEEVRRLLGNLSGVESLICRLIYGSGLRISEVLRLRVLDIDFGYNQITVRRGKGQKDRITMLPESLIDEIKLHLKKVRLLHGRDLRRGYGKTVLPPSVALKQPGAAVEFKWQYVFPSRFLDPTC